MKAGSFAAFVDGSNLPVQAANVTAVLQVRSCREWLRPWPGSGAMSATGDSSDAAGRNGVAGEAPQGRLSPDRDGWLRFGSAEGHAATPAACDRLRVRGTGDGFRGRRFITD